MKKIKTRITTMNNEEEYIRGHKLQELVDQKTFVEVVYLILRGMLPTKKEAEMLNALFVAAIDHGPGTASAQVGRITASAKNSMHTSLAAALLAMGERHGSAIEGAAAFFQQHKNDDVAATVTSYKERKLYIPGFGHATLEHDMRSDVLFGKAKNLGFFGEHCMYALAVQKEVDAQSSASVPINIDGAMAAILLDMGCEAGLMKGFFMIARVPGLVAHIYEEEQNDEGIRRLPEDMIEYV